MFQKKQSMFALALLSLFLVSELSLGASWSRARLEKSDSNTSWQLSRCWQLLECEEKSVISRELRRQVGGISTQFYTQDHLLNADITVFVLVDNKEWSNNFTVEEYFTRMLHGKILEKQADDAQRTWYKITIKKFEVDSLVQAFPGIEWAGLRKFNWVK